MFLIEEYTQNFKEKSKSVLTVLYNVLKKIAPSQCLSDNDNIFRTQYLFRSRLHVIQTIRQTKLALSPNDDKRCLQKNCTDTLAWGHYKMSMDVT